MINPNIALISLYIYSFYIAFSFKFEFLDFLPILFVAILNYKKMVHIIKQLFYLEFYLLFVIFFALIFNPNYEYLLLIFIRYNAILIFMLFLFYKKDEKYLLMAFLMPIFNKKIKTIIFIFIKYITILANEYEKLKETLLVRGFVSKSNFFTYQTISKIVGMLIIRTFIRMQNLKELFIARSFNGELFFIESQKFNLQDFGIIFLILLTIIK